MSGATNVLVRMTLKPALALLLLCACGDPIADVDLSVVIGVEDISPLTVPARGGTELTIIGKNFGRDARVTIGGNAPAATEWKSAERLKVITAPMRVGALPVAVSSGGQTATATTPLVVRVDRIWLDDRSESAAFREVVVQQVAVDMDSDGVDDLYYRDFTDYRTYFARNVDQGASFGVLGPVVAGGQPDKDGGLLVDLNRDGLVDIARADGSFLRAPTLGGDFTIDRAFASPPGWAPTVPSDLLAGDFDGDGAVDLALAVVEPARSTLHVFLLDANGHARTTNVFSLGARAHRKIRAADLNGDQIADLVFSDSDGILHAALGPNMDVAAGWSAPANATQIDIGDIDLDGKPDLFVLAGAGVYFQGRGDGTFEEGYPINAPCSSWGDPLLEVRMADDHVYALCDHRVHHLALGFQVVPYWTPALPLDVESAVFGNFDGDPYPDMVSVSPAKTLVVHGTARGDFERGWGIQVSASSLSSLPASFARGRFATQDDLLIGAFETLSVLSSAAGTPRANTLLASATPGFEIAAVAACDVDGDGRDDAIVLSIPQPPRPDNGLGIEPLGAVQVFYGQAGGLRAGERFEFENSQRSAADLYLLGVDLDGDGRCEPVLQRPGSLVECSNEFCEVAMAYFHDATGLTNPVRIFTGPRAKPADLDGDGDTDFYLVPALSLGANDIEIALNNGHGMFTKSSLDFSLRAPDTQDLLAIADVEIAPGVGGGLEIWATAPTRGDLSFMSGKPYYVAHGRYTFGAPVTGLSLTRATLDYPFPRLARGDMNGDGVSDLLVTSDIEGFRVFASSATGDLVSATTYDDELAVPQLFDTDGDGLLDVVYSTAMRPGTLRVLTTRGE